ncbi:MAG: Endo,4-beta-xylanase precursor, partial [Pseudomonadota bacterium]
GITQQMNHNYSQKQTILLISIFSLATSILTACSGGICLPTNNIPDISIKTPNQYPAGLPKPIDASIEITNNSNFDATDLVYTIPAPGQNGNNTGVTITPKTGSCTSIKAGATCTFTAVIGANSNPGNFTVNVTQKSTNSTQLLKKLNSSNQKELNVSTNIVLVNVPSINNPYYILPNDQTFPASSSPNTEVYISVWVKSAGDGLNQFSLVDQNGKPLNYTSVGTENFTTDSVNTYKIIIPYDQNLQYVQVLSNVCNDLNTGDNNYNACSNNATINLAETGIGILLVQPSYIKMSESYPSQVISVINSGSATVESITPSSLYNKPFIPSNNTCKTSLAAGESCSFVLTYVPQTNSGQDSFVINYYNGKSTQNTTANIYYQGKNTTPTGRLITSPDSIKLDANNLNETIILTNNGESDIPNLILPTLPLPTPLEFDTNSSNCQNFTSLKVGQSCKYVIKYSAPAVANQATISFKYNNGLETDQTDVGVSWDSLSTPIKQGILTPSISSIELDGKTLSKTITLTNDGEANITSLTLPILPTPLQFNDGSSTCQNYSTLPINGQCTYTIKYSAPSTAGNSSFAFSYNNGVEQKNLNITAQWESLIGRLNISPSNAVNLESTNLSQVITLTNNGEADITNLILPSLPAPLTTETTCDHTLTTTGSTKSCTYTIKYSAPATAGESSFAFSYNNGLENKQTDTQTISWQFLSKYIAVGAGGTIVSSTDGNTWNKATSNTSNQLNNIIYANNQYIAVGNNGTILSSSDGNNWTSRTSNVTDNLNAVIYANNQYITVGNNARILTSSDGHNWLSKHNSSVKLVGITYNNNQYLAVAEDGVILKSTDNAETW